MYRSCRPLALLLLAGGTLAACEQTEQTLPFDTAGGTVSRVATGATTLSTAAGAAFHLPADALAPGTRVTLATVTAPASLPSGTPLGGVAFEITGEGAALQSPLRAELRVPRNTPGAWLASVAVGTPTGTLELADAGIDLATGTLRARIPAFGTVIPLIPAPDAVVGVRRLSARAAGTAYSVAGAAAVAVPTRSVRGTCGVPETRCAGLEVRASEDLFEYADSASVLFSTVGGELRFDGIRAAGALEITTPLRLLLQSGATVVTVPVRITATPTTATVVTETAGRISLTRVRATVHTAERSGEEILDLVIHYEGMRAWLTIERSIDTKLAGEGVRSTLSVTVPLVRVP
jgi:hypothetical protein